MIQDLEAGYNHACILISDGTVKCWGYNSYGQLGNGNTDNIGDESGEMGDDLDLVDLGSFTVTQIGSGQDHICAINDNYEMKCWGRNDYGMCGYGHTNNIGDESGEMGESLPIIDLGTDFKARKLVMGNLFTCVISTINGLKCFGIGHYGQLGSGDIETLGNDANEMGKITKMPCCFIYFTSLFFFLRFRNTSYLHVLSDLLLVSGDYLPFVDLGSDFELNDARAGTAFVCATNSDGNVKCWGRNDFGHLGLGLSADENVGDEPNEMGDLLPYLDLGTTCTAATTAMASGCGGHHSAIVCDNLDVKTWGRNSWGQLGNGDDTVLYIGDNSNDMGDNLDPIENDRAPTDLPTFDPTSNPTEEPSQPTINPTVLPTAVPTTSAPTAAPTVDPTTDPTKDPSADPTSYPTENPTTEDPTSYPTAVPTSNPTIGQWITSNDPALPRATRNMAIGRYNNSIFLLYVFLSFVFQNSFTI